MKRRIVERIKSWAVIVGIFTAFGGFVWGTYSYLDVQYAKAEDVQRIEQRLEFKITKDRYETIQERMWKLEDRFPDKRRMPSSVLEEYRQLESEKGLLQEKIKEVK